MTTLSGGVSLDAGRDVTIGGDVVGRDKIVSTTVITGDQQYDVHGLANPYLGLQSFTYADHAKYAGRETLIAETVARVTAPDDPLALLFVTGASGSGKSSFVQAGVLPALEKHYAALNMKWAVFRPSRDPLAALADVLWRQLGLPQFDTYAASPADFGNFLNSNTPPRQVNVIVIDQFEELFTQSAAQPRNALFDLLAHLPSFRATHTHIIATVRADYLPELFALPALYDIAKRGIDLHAMSVDELREAIQQPLRATYPDKDKRFQAELVERLAQDAAEDETYLPLLQVTLEEIWRKGMLTLGSYTNLADAIKQRADKVLAYADYDAAQPDRPRLPDEQAAILGLCLDLVDVSLDDEARHDVRRRRSKDELARGGPDRPRLIDALTQARLFSVDTDPGEQSHIEVDIIHETLLSNWDRLRQAITERRQELRRRARFEQQLKEWIGQSRTDDYLLDGVRLAEARELERRDDIALRNADAKDFLRRSVESAEAERRQELEKAQRMAAAQRRAATLLRWVVIVLALGIIGSLMGGVIAIQQGDEANKQRNEANTQRDEANTQRDEANKQRDEANQQRNLSRARELAAVSIANLDVDPELSLHLALRSITVFTDTLQGEDALRRALLSPPVKFTLHGHAGEVYSVAYDGAGQRLITASADGTARIWDAATGQELMVLRGHTGAVYRAAFSPNGRLAATAGADKTVRIWNADTGQPVFILDKHSEAVNSVAFSPDGQRLVTASADKTARVWDVASGSQVYVLTHDAEVRAAAFSPKGTLIATGGYDQMIKVWNAGTGQLITSFSNSDNTYAINHNVNTIAFSLDEKYVLVDQDYQAVRWDIQNEQIVSEYKGQHSWYVTGVSFSPDGKQVVTVSRDHTVWIWDAESGTAIEVLPGHSGIVYGAAFDPSGDHLATASEDQTVRIWNVAEWRKRVLIGFKGYVVRAAYSSNGRRIATAGDDGMIRIWDAASGRELKAWRYPGFLATGFLANRLHFSPDDRQLITSSNDGTWRLWDAVTGKALFTSTASSDIVSDARFSRDGTSIITTGRDSLGRIWDATTHQQLVLLKGEGNGIWTAMFSPDGQLAVTCGADDTARIWDARTGEQLHLLSGHSDLVTSAAFDSKGKRIVTASVDGTARIWDVSTGQMLHILKGHTRELTDATFSPDDQTIATASRDHTIILWNADTGDEIIQLFGHHQDVFSVEFSPDGRYLLTASLDGTVRIYPVHFADALALARSVLSPRELTCEERVKYLHEGCPTPAPASQVTPAP